MKGEHKRVKVVIVQHVVMSDVTKRFHRVTPPIRHEAGWMGPGNTLVLHYDGQPMIEVKMVADDATR